MQHTAYIGLGSNLDNPLQQVKTALTELHLNTGVNVQAVSNIYQSQALEVKHKDVEKQQDDYINAVACIKTHHSPVELLSVLQTLEVQHKRVKEYRWGPRSLDLDILLFNDLILETEQLCIPHIELANRDFVLYPLNDISSRLIIPSLGALKDLLLNITNENLILLEPPPKI